FKHIRRDPTRVETMNLIFAREFVRSRTPAMVALAFLLPSIQPLSTAVAADPGASAVVFDVSKDFSATNNPNGAWRYGWKETISGSFSNMTRHLVGADDGGLPVQVWETDFSKLPAVFFNGTTNPLLSAGGAAQYPPGTCA